MTKKTSGRRMARQWPQDVAKAPEIIPVTVSPASLNSDTIAQNSTASESVMLFLPGGIRMYCQSSELTDVFRALRYADT